MTRGQGDTNEVGLLWHRGVPWQDSETGSEQHSLQAESGPQPSFFFSFPFFLFFEIKYMKHKICHIHHFLLWLNMHSVTFLMFPIFKGIKYIHLAV